MLKDIYDMSRESFENPFSCEEVAFAAAETNGMCASERWRRNREIDLEELSKNI